MLAGGIASLSFVVLAITWSVMAFAAADARREALETAIKRIDAELANGSFARARKAYDALLARHAALADSPELIEPNARIEFAERKEEGRVRQFKLGLEAAGAEPPGDPNASSLIKKLRELASLPEEKAAVDSLVAERIRRESTSKARADGEVLRLIESLEPKLASCESDVEARPLAAETGEGLKDLKPDIARLRDMTGRAGEEARGKAAAFIGRYERAQAARTDRLDQDVLEKAIVLTVRINMFPEHLDEYAKRCRDYRKRFPGTPRSRDLELALARLDTWKAAVDWDQIVGGWGGGLDGLQPREVARLTAATTAHRGKFKAFPDDSVIADAISMLQAARAANDESEDGPSRKLSKVFSNPLVDGLWSVSTGSGKVYYSMVEPFRNSAGIQIKAVRGVPTEGSRDFPVKVLGRDDQPSQPALSPQSRVAKKVTGLLTGMSATPESWDKTMAEIILAIRNEAEMDPILQLLLLSRTMSLASEGSYALKKCLDSTIATIKDPANDIDFDAHWFNPDDHAADIVRRKARAVLVKVPALTNLAADAKANRDLLNARIHRPYRPAGCLMQDESGRWRCFGPKGMPRAEELWVMSSDNAWSRVGRSTEAGELVIEQDTSDRNALVQGQLVFSRAASR